jgi:hypothetical protein
MGEFVSLMTVLGPWFDKPLSELPAEVQLRVVKEFRIPWDSLSPRRRRMVAVQLDWRDHPTLQQANQIWWEKQEKIDKCERTASNIPIENRTAVDVDLQEEKSCRLRNELAAIEADLARAADSLGLVWPADLDAVGRHSEGTPESLPEAAARSESAIGQIEQAASLETALIAAARKTDARRGDKPSARAARPPRARIVSALQELFGANSDTRNYDVGTLQNMALEKSGIRGNHRGASKRTFERALKIARATG